MPIDVRMPDGTVIQNVPDGITQADLTARYSRMQSGAAASPFADNFNNVGAETTQDASRPPDYYASKPLTPGNAADAAGNVGVGLYSGVAGIPGDMESLIRWASRKGGAVSQQNMLPTTSDISNGDSALSIAGAPQSHDAAVERGIGSFLSPVAAARAVSGAAKISRAAKATIPSTVPPELRARILLSRAYDADKMDPANAADALAQFGDKPVTAMDVGGPSVGRLARTVKTLPGDGSAQLTDFLAERQADQGGRVLGDINTMLAKGRNPYAVSDELERQQAAASPIYKEAFEANPSVSSPEIEDILRTPAGKQALASGQTMMQNDMSPVTAGSPVSNAAIPKGTLDAAKADVAYARAAPPNEPTLLQTIRARGGIKILDHKGDLTSEGSDIQSMLDKNSGLYRSVVNNQSGSDLDTIRESLNEDGWFGGSPRGDTTINDLLDLIGREGAGEKLYHPTSEAAQTIEAQNGLRDEMRLADVDTTDSPAEQANKLAAFRHLKSRADALGVPYNLDADVAALRNAVGKVEPLAPRASGLNLRTHDYIKQALDDQVAAARRAGSKNEAAILTGLVKRYRSALDTADATGGKYAQARAAFAGPAASQDAIEQGQAFLKMQPEEIASAMRDLGDSDRQFFQIGAARALHDRVSGMPDGADAVARVFGNKTVRGQIRAVFGDKAADQFAQAMTPEKIGTMTNRFVRGNSTTADKLADMNDTAGEQVARDAMEGFQSGGIRGAIARPLVNRAKARATALFNGMNPAVRASLADLMTQTGMSAEGVLRALQAAKVASPVRNANVFNAPSIASSPVLRALLLQGQLSRAVVPQGAQH